ncbi:hypothetical protein N658DRAFT_31367 [Parathielavia hyrcaniae]|uniref:Uncharacterized protein n=1 Tax=Parathielavia hyrcaniae TaxID=113614 RepID=A0AAN6QGI1_9PEZI|nr:hypothetical protein N658DRAFT_31367 [Parathielavia hyrcaniae]
MELSSDFLLRPQQVGRHNLHHLWKLFCFILFSSFLLAYSLTSFHLAFCLCSALLSGSLNELSSPGLGVSRYRLHSTYLSYTRRTILEASKLPFFPPTTYIRLLHLPSMPTR